jgi:hypothetical protein
MKNSGFPLLILLLMCVVFQPAGNSGALACTIPLDGAIVNYQSEQSGFYRKNIFTYQTTLPQLPPTYEKVAISKGQLLIHQDPKWFDTAGEIIKAYDSDSGKWFKIGVMSPANSSWQSFDLDLNRFFNELHNGLQVRFVYHGGRFAEAETAYYQLSHVSPVPIPSAAYLVASGVIALVSLRKRYRGI